MSSLSTTVAMFGWLSTFVLGWLLVLDMVKRDGVAWMFFVFFFAVAIFASAQSATRRRVVTIVPEKLEK